MLESRLDNVVLRAGFAPTRSAARQMVSHGHITVDGAAVTVPSFAVKPGMVIGIREGSKGKVIFSKLDEELKTVTVPAWMKVDIEKKVITIDGKPSADTSELLFDLESVLQFYTR
jgi:small subunit ribosomal protein S4